MHELSKSFIFEAAHTLHRQIDADPSRRIHGHSYRAVVTLRGSPDENSGMLIDLGLVNREIERVRALVDHRFLDEVHGLGPATLENLCSFLWQQFSSRFSGLVEVTVSRESCR
ncbi:6-pyruvoyl trahydropterin synthase family protein [Paraburkholderia terricola]|uniref:6-pyruvoyl trahydropterin synthase family protein n=1 Tax=Paraburkholderia terricola TaxID=169427 RepID=UPI00286AF66A|nr:6-carboxytetrahydropterin synthase [Paraburkholderia terricola]